MFSTNEVFLQREGHIKDKAARALLDDASNETCDENGRYASFLLAIHGFLVPSAKFCSKNAAGKTTHIKYTTKDSQESFLFYAKTQQELEEHIVHRKSQRSAIQPFILCLGDDITKLSNIYFPQQSKMFWNFLEKCFFKHDVPIESPRMQMLYDTITDQ